ncbi:helix-hairpin-helix domain-containing protein [Salipaludibacillus sp. CUR1]|uniref:ComEA family DNA-binding protein n=1 Tax=Salipaludibacillus sp. CUR1 TaxID=2820003 RepID=UPI001E634343|nr:helix-hairpin-helix domain-containing protein [Salipaludibacillus sp. CUR1]MCE7792711.1 helix-hairpin-helix domain-containing protein [Salipaludibacillus sp. CUR1]
MFKKLVVLALFMLALWKVVLPFMNRKAIEAELDDYKSDKDTGDQLSAGDPKGTGSLENPSAEAHETPLDLAGKTTRKETAEATHLAETESTGADAPATKSPAAKLTDTKSSDTKLPEMEPPSKEAQTKDTHQPVQDANASETQGAAPETNQSYPETAPTDTPATQESEAQTADSSAPADPGKIDVNTAGPADLLTIPGVGADLSQKILNEREKNGPFNQTEDLLRVPGIGEKKLEQMKSSLLN